MESEFRFKQKKNEIRLEVIKELEDGTEAKKILIFDCSPENYGFVKQVNEVAKTMSVILSERITLQDMEGVKNAAQAAFETVAPGQWEEYFAFLGQDLGDMAQLLTLMIKTVGDKGTSAKAASLAPVIPDGDTV